ncbi:hypothetical protein N658DRAFT_108605 [Parathielavia hyrcaniae]|uniref:Uncharacterized protein n=1 Tax=Parathielavia hyrcaniae TaxID=113614 RepID=A0AAN6PYI8_9PEZI|nr:hypothetical protein N658DRAFT_108605 [Parathielavia hyrcaniae]
MTLTRSTWASSAPRLSAFRSIAMDCFISTSHSVVWALDIAPRPCRAEKSRIQRDSIRLGGGSKSYPQTQFKETSTPPT